MSRCVVLLIGVIFQIMIQSRLSGQCTFNISNNSPCSAETVTFSVDAPNAGAQYDWDFDGDGATDAEGETVDHSFPLSGTEAIYSVILFENGDTCTTQDITVLATPDPSIGVRAHFLIDSS